MLTENNNLTIYPLFWVYHDFWEYTKTVLVPDYYGYKAVTKTYDHLGHIHFFIPGFSIQNLKTQQAYNGKQYYKYDLNELWSPNSLDPNQQYNVKIIGKPKWYFYIEEYWRRVYIQQWEYVDNDTNTTSFIGKKGLKWDASLPQHTRGIFREGKDNYFFYTDLCRTLPIEYWKNENKTVRDHYLRLNNSTPEYLAYYDSLGSSKWTRGVNSIATPEWDFSNDYPSLIDETIPPAYNPDDNKINYCDYYTHFDEFTIPRNYTCKGDYSYLDSLITSNNGEVPVSERYKSWSDEDGARINYADRYFIAPTMEYQKVIHKNWERLDGYEERDLEDEETGFNFGDGYQQEIEIPFRKEVDGEIKIQSPFSDDNGKVYPPGEYFHGVVKDEDKLYFRHDIDEKTGEVKYNNYELELFYNRPRETFCYPNVYDATSSNGSDKNLYTGWESRIPSGYPIDGMWVEQCLGALVKAKVKVITEDMFGGRQINWIETTNFMIDDPFEGKDYLG